MLGETREEEAREARLSQAKPLAAAAASAAQEKPPNPSWEHVTMITGMILTALKVAELVLKEVAAHREEKKQ